MKEEYESELSLFKIIPERIKNLDISSFDSKEEIIELATQEIYEADEFNPVRYQALIILLKDILRGEVDKDLNKKVVIKKGLKKLEARNEDS